MADSLLFVAWKTIQSSLFPLLLLDVAMNEAGDKVSDDEKKNIESAVEALKEAMKTDDKDAIESKTKALTDASGKMAERMYGQQGQPGAEGMGGQGGHTHAGAEQGGAGQSQGENVVDAEFEEVKDEKEKK